MKVLLANIGRGINRHYNAYNVILKLLKQKYDVSSVDLLTCSKFLKACDCRNDINSLPNDTFELKDWRRNCSGCASELNSRLFEVDNFIKLGDVVDLLTSYKAEKILRRLKKNYTVEEFLLLQIDGVNIGKDVWSSAQRYSFIGSDIILEVRKGTIIYEYLRSGIILYLACKKLFQKNKYDLIVSNEISYFSWGIVVRLALSMGIRVIHQGWSYMEKNYITITTYDGSDTPFSMCATPEMNEFNAVLADPAQFEKYQKAGEEYLQPFYKKFTQARNDKDIYARLLKQYPSIHPDRKNVVVFTHLCWDGSVAHGTPLFPTFESYYDAVYAQALNNKNVNWFFKLHPAELNDDTGSRPTHEKINTRLYLHKLHEKYGKPENIYIIEDDSTDIFNIIDVCMTTLGTVRYEMPSAGIPVIISETGLHDPKWDFLIMPQNVAEFNKIVGSIASCQLLGERQRKIAQAYAGVLFDKKRYISVASLWDADSINTVTLTDIPAELLTEENNYRLIESIFKT